MMLVKSVLVASVVAAATTTHNATVIPFTLPNTLDVTKRDSIKAVSSSLAFGAMSYYKGNVSGDPKMIGDVPDPYYWWVGGALWGAMVDYWHYTGDPSYNDVVIQALTAPVNTGPHFDFMPPEHAFEEGNDDLGFWSFAVMAAAEANLPQPHYKVPPWLVMGRNIFYSLASRWNTTNCGGGLLWQIYASNPNGLNYKNSVSNGGFFQLSARLAAATGNNSYTAWAERVWDWSVAVGIIDKDLKIYDGVDARDNCTKVNLLSFSYSTGIYLYGAAVMAKHTGQEIWRERARKILATARTSFFYAPGPDPNTLIMYEPPCEPIGRCNNDQTSFKGYLSRFMWKSTIVMPELLPQVKELLIPSARAAANVCSANATTVFCGEKWYVSTSDGILGLGQTMSALEIVQGLVLTVK